MSAKISVTDSLQQKKAKRGTKGVLMRAWSRVPLLPVAIFLVLMVIGPYIVPFSPIDVVATPNQLPGGDHYFGTDSTGLDVFSRTIAAARNDILIAGISAIVATLIGILIGLLVGMNEARGGVVGWFARIVVRGLDLLQAIPAIVIALALVSIVGTSVMSLAAAMVIILTPNQARMVRTEVLKVRSDAYVDAARMAGEREFGLTVRHVLPNASWPALENASLVFGAAIFITAALGFLGVGLRPPTPEWGSMLSIGAKDAAVGRWWSFLFPAIALILAVVSFATAGQHIFGQKKDD